jgi:mRNA-degrading endonuclease RelE of RelBE toxin-antitoxin system
MPRDVVSTQNEDRYQLQIAPSPANALSGLQPEKVALAVLEFINGPLLENPHRVGEPLRAQLAPAYSARRGTYRVLYLIVEENRTVRVTAVAHRGVAYRS